MTKKITKRENYNTLLSLSEVQSNPELVAFIEHELELLDKKNSVERKPSEKQVANDGLRDAIVAAMEPNKLYTLSQLAELVPALNGATPQRMSALVNAVTNDEAKGKTGLPVNKVVDKRKAYFTLA